MSKFKEVFDVHPDAEELYVVDNQPFLGKVEAKNFARQFNGKDKDIEVVKRGPSEEELEAQKQAAADAKANKKAEAEAAKKQAAAEKKAKAEAEKKAAAEKKAKEEADAKKKEGGDQ